MSFDLNEIKAIGLAIRVYRMQQNLSQEGLADVCGLHRTYIGSVERGERNLSARNIFTISAALNIKASQLIRKAEDILNSSEKDYP